MQWDMHKIGKIWILMQIRRGLQAAYEVHHNDHVLPFASSLAFVVTSARVQELRKPR